MQQVYSKIVGGLNRHSLSAREGSSSYYQLKEEPAKSRDEKENGQLAFDHSSIQFVSTRYIVKEGLDEVATLDVMRTGTLKGRCSVNYHTESLASSTQAKFVPTTGCLQFAEGEQMKSFSIKLVDNDLFDASFEFAIKLNVESAVNCNVHRKRHTATVMILDDDTFPSNALTKQVRAGTPDPKGPAGLDADPLYEKGFTMVHAFIKFAVNRVPSVWWKSLLIILLDQMDNVFYYVLLKLKVYLVDICLNLKDDMSSDWFVKGDRFLTLVTVATIWVAPNLLLSGKDYFKMAVLEVGFSIRLHLRLNLFKKYLTLSESWQKKVPLHDLHIVMNDDIPDVVHGSYLVMFELLQDFGKIVVVGWFISTKNPSNAVFLIFYPLLMTLFLACRYQEALKLLSAQGEGESEYLGIMSNAVQHRSLIRSYGERVAFVSKFQNFLERQHHVNLEVRTFEFVNDKMVPWLTNVFTFIFLIYAGNQVIHKELSLGSYLATINVYKDLGDRMVGIMGSLRTIINVIDPLAGLTLSLNLPCRMEEARDQQTYRRLKLQEAVANYHASPENGEGSFESIYDKIEFSFINVKINGLVCDATIDVKTPQGSIVAISGVKNSGKRNLLHLLADLEPPVQGQVIIPMHLTRVHVTHQADIMETYSLYDNLTYASSDVDPQSVVSIARRLGLCERHLKLIEKEIKVVLRKSKSCINLGYEAKEESCLCTPLYCCDVPEEEEEEEEEDHTEADFWANDANQSTLRRVHLARAFVHNPQVLVLDMPLEGLAQDDIMRLLSVLRDFVENRGLEKERAYKHLRMPRSVFFTVSATHLHQAAEISDYIWHLDERGIKVSTAGNVRQASREYSSIPKEVYEELTGRPMNHKGVHTFPSSSLSL